jgi:hypothetical protein
MSAKKLAICVPVRDTIHSGFTYCLTELVAKLVTDKIEYNLYFENGSILPDQRNRLVDSAKRDECTEILWLDSDMVFPPDVYFGLSKRKRSVVACNYSTRHWPFRSVAFTSDKDMDNRLTKRKGLHEVASVGMGVMLTDMKVFEKLHLPYFSFKYDRKTESYIGEDVEFCRTARDYDFKIYVDADLSEKCAHLGTAPRRMDMIEDA